MTHPNSLSMGVREIGQKWPLLTFPGIDLFAMLDICVKGKISKQLLRVVSNGDSHHWGWVQKIKNVHKRLLIQVMYKKVFDCLF